MKTLLFSAKMANLDAVRSHPHPCHFGGVRSLVALASVAFLAVMPATVQAQNSPADHFLLKITTTEGTNVDDRSFTFYTEDTNYDIDWDNDGTFEVAGVSGNQPHTFATAGEHTIRFRNLNDVYINDQTGKEKYTSIEQWGTAVWNADMEGAFRGAINLTMALGAGTPDMSVVEDMESMFRGATSFNGDISGWNTVAVEDMYSMFREATAFNQDISGWNTVAVKDMKNMFRGATFFDGDISGWNTVAVEDMYSMFREATSFNQDIGGWNTVAVKDMKNMFRGATAFNQDISGWNTVAVEDMYSMFREATSLNQDIGGWNTVAVEDMSSMFREATSFNGDISGWNTALVEDMENMFFGATSFDQNIGGWNVASVTDMDSVFFRATSFNQDIGVWNVEAVVYMEGMFSGATSFDQNIGGWNVEAVEFMEDMFLGVTLSIANYDALLVGWDGQSLQTGVTFGGGDSKYSSDEAHTARANMTATTANGGDNWTIRDGGRAVAVQPNAHAPVFAGGATAGVTYAENGTMAVTTVVATDADTGQTIAFTLSGDDAGLFSITPAGGELRFTTSPDYENPADTGGNNMYEVTITATDNGMPAKMARQALTITVTDELNEVGNPVDPAHFVLKITTNPSGTNSADKSFTFYTQDRNYDIDWDDDGTFEATGVSGNQPHTFAVAGEHTIRFRDLNDININNQADTLKYTSIEQWGTSVWNADMRNAFRGAE